jgi:hypothetical protein
VDELLHPAPPVLQNTDGDPLLFVRMNYDLLCSPREALESLQELVLPEFREDILEDAEYDAEGELSKVSITWQKRGNRLNKSWENTSLGTIIIGSGALTAEVNSKKRASRLRSEIRRRLGRRAIFRNEEQQSADRLIEEQRGQPRRASKPKGAEELALFQAALREEMERHWEAWLDQPIGLLLDETPRQAARTPKGRERLEALLMDIEYRNEHLSQPELRADVSALRRKLGL